MTLQFSYLPLYVLHKFKKNEKEEAKIAIFEATAHQIKFCQVLL